jgi:hypothetical protein
MWPVALLGLGAALAVTTNRGPSNLVSVRSSVNGQTYKVQNLPDKEEAANKMAELQGKIEKLINFYREDPSAMGDPRVRTMIERFNPQNMMENSLDDDSTSYSENKGEKIVVCMRDKTPGAPFVDSNTVTFVLLHEMAHLMSTTVGHTPEFWANFRRILHDAIQAGVYENVNYAKNPVQYCGMTITDSPL